MDTKNTQDHSAAWPSSTSFSRSAILPHGHSADALVASSSQLEVQHTSNLAHLESVGREDTASNRAHHGRSATVPSKAREPSPKRRHPISSKDWEAQRANITRLYATEGKPLSKVAAEMRDVWGFNAT